MVIVGITGAIGHGKSTLANALTRSEPKSLHLESYKLIAEVIDGWHQKLETVPKAGDYEALNVWLKALPPIIKRTCHKNVSYQTLKIEPADIANDPIAYQKLFLHLDALKSKPGLSKTRITDTNKAEYRPILQWVGGYLVGKAGNSTWWDEIIRRAKKIDDNGVKLVILSGVRYPGDADVVRKAGGKIIEIQRPDLPESDVSDPTERERQKIKPDSIVINRGSLLNLNAAAKLIVEDLVAHSLKKQYNSVVK